MAVRKKTKKKAAAKKHGTTHKKKGGQPPFVPTKEQRTQVEMLLGCGLTYKEIATVTINPRTNSGISTKTLQQHFVDELQSGQAKVKGMVIGSLVRKACGKGPGAVAAAIFLCKTRYGFRETQHVEIESNAGVLIAPASKTPAEWIREQNVLNEDRKPPESRHNSNGNGDDR